MQQVPDNRPGLPQRGSDVHHSRAFRTVQSFNEQSNSRQTGLTTSATSSYNLETGSVFKDLLLPVEEGKIQF
jgi:hypothetical protein